MCCPHNLEQFKREGVLKDAVKDGDQYADDILMAILEDEWRELK